MPGTHAAAAFVGRDLRDPGLGWVGLREMWRWRSPGDMRRRRESSNEKTIAKYPKLREIEMTKKIAN